MNNLTLSQEADRGGHFRIPDSPQYVVISGTRLLFGSQILSQVGNNIALGLEFAGIERDSSGSLRPQSGGMIDIIRTKTRVLNFFHGEILGQLINDSAYHFKMRKLLGTDIRKQPGHFTIRHGITLRKITHGCAQLAVGPAILRNNELCQLGVRLRNFYRKLKSFFIIPHLCFTPLPMEEAPCPISIPC